MRDTSPGPQLTKPLCAWRRFCARGLHAPDRAPGRVVRCGSALRNALPFPRGLEAQQRGHQGDIPSRLNGTCMRQWLALPVLGWQLGGKAHGGWGATDKQYTRAGQPRADGSSCSGSLGQLAHTPHPSAQTLPPPAAPALQSTTRPCHRLHTMPSIAGSRRAGRSGPRREGGRQCRLGAEVCGPCARDRLQQGAAGARPVLRLGGRPAQCRARGSRLPAPYRSAASH